MIWLNVLRRVQDQCIRRSFHSTFVVSRDNSASTAVEDPIVLSDDGSYFICWHPEKPYPYECTKPLPKEKETEKYLLKNMGSTYSNYEKRKDAKTVAEELAKVTYTTKHRWFPRARDKYAKKTPPDRDYL